jgi:tRNA modification GTPase
MYVTDTIAAIATPAGPGAIAILRVSGNLCRAVAQRVFRGSVPVQAWRSHHLYHGRLLDGDGTPIDAGLAVLMRAPRSYTGEDVLELHGHGSPLVMRRILTHVLACGARLAEPGEFTKRAFLNGRIDLPQAEAVIDLIRARSSAGAALAAAQLDGRLSEALADIRERLLHLKALLEALIDFSEEDVVIPSAQIAGIAQDAGAAIESLLATYRHGSLVREGLRVALAGKPNVGKSSLLNALLGSDRAIVTEIAGTTRDTIEESADFHGIPVVLTDTAGLRDTGSVDPIERLGIHRAAAALRQAHVVVAVLDRSRALDEEDRSVLTSLQGSRFVVAANKIDLPPAWESEDLELPGGTPVVRVSAQQRLGLDPLRQAVVQLVEQNAAPPADAPVLTNARHQAALQRSREALRLACASIDAQQPADLVAVDAQAALDEIGSITGAITSEDVLDRIFQEFCIGK